ncbi:MAG: hypothetical protein IID34_16150 [Planctomycetes bacterium]|nr:hypothetical protein [Planctomycetota bacterium]
MVVRLVSLREECTDLEKRTRVEFIFDTNAMVEGVGHWLVDLFADSCDLVVTAVTLRELQDQREIAQFSTHISKVKEKKPGKALSARQLYLAANRFRECVGYNRVLWRELELDDTALLLSRGSGGEKRSESDTLLLRSVRRSIHDRVNGLERFFVTGDTALARRASSELPPGSVIAAQVKELVPGQTYFPCAWWPGPDQGRRVHRHPARLLWEFLAITDEIELKNDNGDTWTLRAFVNPMWPSDYSAPWVLVDGPPSTVESESAITPSQAAGMIWASGPSAQRPLDANLRLSAQMILDLLAAVATSIGDSVAIPEKARGSPERRHHTKLLLEGLDLARVNEDCTTAKPLQQQPALAKAWQSGDHDAVFDIIRGWKPLAEWTTRSEPPKRPSRTQETARALAGLLGQGAYIEGSWIPGGQRPTVAEVRKELLDAIPKAPPRALPMYEVLVEVFLRRLNVHPLRVLAAWDRMKELGVFMDFEPRKGGSSSGRHELEVADFSSSGWTTKRIDLEAFRGYRDLNYRGASSE